MVALKFDATNIRYNTHIIKKYTYDTNVGDIISENDVTSGITIYIHLFIYNKAWNNVYN